MNLSVDLYIFSYIKLFGKDSISDLIQKKMETLVKKPLKYLKNGTLQRKISMFLLTPIGRYWMPTSSSSWVIPAEPTT